MASAYALPLDSSTHVYGHHAHGHSRSHHHLRSERSSSWLGQINEVAVKRTPSSTNLDSQPPAGPPSHQDVAAANAASVEMNETIALGRPFTPTKTRYQSEAEQGQLRPSPKARPATHAYGFASRVTEPDAVISEPWVTAREALTAILVPLPYIFASLAYPSAAPSTAPSSPYERLMDPVSADERTAALSGGDAAGASALLQASCLASGTLLLAGLIGALSPPDKVLDRRKRGFSNANVSLNKGGDILQNDAPRRIVARVLSVGLPYYAAAQLGGARTSFVLLTALGSGLTGLNINPLHQNFVKAWARVVSLRKLTCAVLLLAFLLDLSGLTTGFGTRHLFLGYVSLALSIFFFSPPLAVTGWSPISTPYAASTGSISALETPFDTPKQAVKASLSEPLSPLVSSSEDIKLTLVSGGILSVFTVLYAAIVSTHPPLSYGSILFAALAMSSALGSIFLSLPISLRSSRKIGVALGYFVTIIFGYSLHADAWKGIVALGVLSCFAYMAVLYDTVPKSPSLKGQDNHYQNPTKHAHHDHSHLHDRSKISGQLIALCTPGSIIHSILIEKDSRRIAYFACLNLAFMLVQFFYGFVSGSLGLLTDSIHMLFDCLGLAVGLAAAVMTKRPPNARFPYGYGKIDTLSGFANGIFLMLVSVEIVFDAFEKLYEGHEMRRLNELLIVSVLGLLVNIVGLTAFGHAHHGHDHDHGHSHDGHGHSHDNENMHGIFLHILADTLGSVAVIVSTILTKWTGWAGWDPIASTLIAILIALSAYPLVKSSGMRLLLSMPADVEYKIRNTLQEISSLRGVVGYTVPKFWLEDAGAAHADAHAHDHSHAHTHEHSHDHVSKHDSPCSSHGPEEHKHHHHDDHHSHGHGHDHDHKHASCNGHSHDHDHDHDHIHAHDHNHEHGHGHSHSHSHSHSHDHGHSHEPHQKKILGVIHIIASRLADLADVQERTMQFLRGRGMDVLVHVEREGDGFCWCGGGKQVSG